MECEKCGKLKKERNDFLFTTIDRAQGKVDAFLSVAKHKADTLKKALRKFESAEKPDFARVDRMIKDTKNKVNNELDELSSTHIQAIMAEWKKPHKG